MRPITTSMLAFSLLVVGIVAVTHILILLGRDTCAQNNTSRIKYFKWAHRISGYIFFILYLFICAIMLQKLAKNSIALPAKDAIHAYIGIAIFPLIIVKICIVRFYKKFYKSLPVYGMITMLAVYLTVPMSAGCYVLSSIESQYVVILEKGSPVSINVNTGRKLVQQRCSTCHSLERVFSYVKTEAGWRDYISRMRAKDPVILDDKEALQAVGYLTKTLGIDEAKMDVTVGMKIILEKCHKCHTMERVFTFKKTQAEWAKTIELMRAFDPFLLNDSETRQVNYYLSNILARKNTES
ncbi:MAG: hypothetical protein A2Z57_01690 [Planctomycetes bacterium RIFCSPHIGHO2_12_39_6]|nr:MAG: hypothetical protein A2Z57_01690 [Planctomycetes bacterium RIFCSPHIGHO2_12_39_6]